MGTRGTIKVMTDYIAQENGELKRGVLTFLYKHYDSYPTGLGNDLKKLFGKSTFVNELGQGENRINGIDHAAVLLVAHLANTNSSGVYMLQASNATTHSEEYNYTLWEQDKVMFMKCVTGSWDGNEGECIYYGPIASFDGDSIEKAMNNE